MSNDKANLNKDQNSVTIGTHAQPFAVLLIDSTVYHPSHWVRSAAGTPGTQIFVDQDGAPIRCMIIVGVVGDPGTGLPKSRYLPE